MEVYGIVVAVSEKISVEHCVGLLFMLYNPDLEIHFCLFVYGELIESWQTIHVNQCCKFSDLKLGVLQTSSGGKVILLKTTEISTFFCMDDLQCQKSCAMEYLKNFISVQGIDRLIISAPSLESVLVSYEGSVTKLRNSKMGIYELDFKVLVYTTFNTSCMIPTVGSKVIVSNAHLIQDNMGVPILVCCGLSCVKNSKLNDINDKWHTIQNELSDNFCIQYGLNIFDVLWFERLLTRLIEKFDSLISNVQFLFRLDSSFIQNTLDYFLYSENETTNKKLSFVEEFLSLPHQCFPFSKSKLPTSCSVPDLCKVFDEITENASWIDAGPKWKFCVGSRPNVVLIGILYASTAGNFYFVDGTLKLPIILSKDCNSCCHDQNILQKLKKSDDASIVVIQEYDIIVENISSKNIIEQSIQYIRTSFCRLYSLFSLSKSTPNDYFTLQQFSCEFKKNGKDVGDISDFHNNSEAISHRFLILSKIWILQNKAHDGPCFLVLLLSENSKNIREFNDESNLGDSFNFYDSQDDVEFANLISKLDFLHIEENEHKLGYLYFRSMSQNDIVVPGHIYYLHPRDSNKKFDLIFDEKDPGIFTWLLKPDVKIMHDPSCTGSHRIEDYGGVECHELHEIILKRQLNKNWFVSCVLQDKTYECEGKSKSTLCMVVKSEESTIQVYVPHFLGGLCGLLPGTSLQLFGFLCFCSHRNRLYLKASSKFGIRIEQPEKLTGSEKISNSLKGNLVYSHRSTESKFHCPVKSLCFVVKILSAEVFSANKECNRHGRCDCQQKIRLQLCALIDNGNQLLLVHCFDEMAKKILNINEIEWQLLVSYTESSRQFLTFSDKVFRSKSALIPFMDQVFNSYCLSKATSRKLIFEYIYIPKPCSSPIDLPCVLCKSVEDADCEKQLKRNYLKLTNNNCNFTENFH